LLLLLTLLLLTPWWARRDLLLVKVHLFIIGIVRVRRPNAPPALLEVGTLVRPLEIRIEEVQRPRVLPIPARRKGHRASLGGAVRMVVPGKVAGGRQDRLPVGRRGGAFARQISHAR